MEQLAERNVNLKDYLVIIYRGRWIVLFSFILVMGFTTYYTFTAIPIYKASTKIMIKENKSMERAVFNFSSMMKKETMINNHIEILRSHNLTGKVILKLQHSKYAKKLSLLGYYIDHDTTQQTIKSQVRKSLAGVFNFNTEAEEVSLPSFDEIVASLQDGIQISPIRETDIIELSCQASSPFEAAYVTNTIAMVFKEENQLESQQEVRQVKTFLQEQLGIVKEKLSKSEIELKDYKEQVKLVGLPEEIQELITRLTEFESLYQAAKLELESNQQRLNYINRQLSKTKKYINLDNVIASPVLDELKRSMAELQAKKAIYSAGLINQGVFNANSPQLKKYEEQLNSLKEKFKASLFQLASVETMNPLQISENLFERKIQIEAEVQSLKPKVTELKKIVDQYGHKFDAIPEKSLRLARLERTAKVDEKIFLMMNEKFEESRITEVGQLGNVRIIDFAKPPMYPISPKVRMNLILGFLMGLGLGIGITFFREYLDNTIHTVEDVQNLGFALLGSIPEIKLDEAIKKIRQKNQNKLPESRNGNQQEIATIVSRMISHFAPKSPIAEAYRTLRTNIQYSRSDQKLKTLMVTSPGPREGKSTTIVNLAITIAQTGSRTLLVDSDLRRPVLHSVFGLPKTIGLSNCIIGKVKLAEAYFPTDITDLFLMPCGTLPPNPSELLSSSSMKQILEEMKQQFDVILFDSPPIIAVTDAAVLSALADGVILVVQSRQTDVGAAQRANELLKNVRAPVLGALLNNVQIESMYGSYYYYYHYYYYYGKDGDKKRKRRAA